MEELGDMDVLIHLPNPQETRFEKFNPHAVTDESHVDRSHEQSEGLRKVAGQGDRMRVANSLRHEVAVQQIRRLQAKLLTSEEEHKRALRVKEEEIRIRELLLSKLRKSENKYKEELQRKEEKIITLDKALTSEREHIRAKEKPQLQEILRELNRVEKLLQQVVEQNGELRSRVSKLQEEQKMKGLQQTENDPNCLEEQKDHANQVANLNRKHKEEITKMDEIILSIAKKFGEDLAKSTLEKKELQDKLSEVTNQDLNSKAKMNKIGAKEKEQAEAFECEKEWYEETINALVMKEREATNETVEAHKTSITVLEELCNSQELIEGALARLDQPEAQQTNEHRPAYLSVTLKRAGSIDQSNWILSCKQRYKNHNGGWETKMKSVLSKWESLLLNPSFQPFRTLMIGDGKSKQEVDPENNQLISLRKELGEEVYTSVITALMEIEEHNPSGRYPIRVAWISKESRRATLNEVISYLGTVIKALTADSIPRKKECLLPAAANDTRRDT